jgi:hypothetical protein
MGELVSKSDNSFDSNSVFTWKDLKKHKHHFSVNLKRTKNGDKNAKVFIFRFKIKNLCPFSALNSYLMECKNFNFDQNTPVFRISDQKFLTKRFINKFLNNILPGKKISCHSFRYTIPSLIANFPDLTNELHAAAWGRWRSKAFSSYMKFKVKQKKWVFRKIEKALLKSKK